MRQLYLLGGLGADKRVFKNLELGDYNLNYIDWIIPTKSESIANYAKRLLTQIKTPNPILIGVSFGGMVITEIGKLIQTDKIILISSAHVKEDLPLTYRLIGKLKLNRIIPVFLLKKTNKFTYWIFGANNSEDKALLKVIIKETDSRFLQWAIDKIVNWNNSDKPENSIKIHGTDDHLIPMRNADFRIESAGHLMIFNKAKVISRTINSILIGEQRMRNYS